MNGYLCARSVRALRSLAEPRRVSGWWRQQRTCRTNRLDRQGCPASDTLNTFIAESEKGTALVAALGNETDFTVRAYLALGGYRSLDFDTVHVWRT